ncbi:hypothetical protein LTR85_000866 [Meristemomyces frigidus]|nr:hypothetical protein LTR85_000866 [Meristemomyces frigidus]
MKKTLLRCLALPVFVFAFPPFHHGTSDGLTVSTTSGQVHGKVDPALPNVHQFLGIPYAVPPVGNLRWTAPRLLDQPSAHIEATELPVSCPQYLTNQGNSLYVRDVLQFNLQGLNTTGAISEDCLTVSVWAPSNATTGKQGGHHRSSSSAAKSDGLPVLIFIYGGGFSTGGVDVPYQIPAQWVNRTPDHIVVSFNYRVNVFGFPNAAGLGEQNFGLLDQRAVVEWCQKNIAAFGGDPDRMVIWGQSAGSISVDFYNFAYPTDPIVSGLIMDSGTAESPITTDDTTHSNFTFVAEHVGCSGLASAPAQQLACMRNVSAAKLEDFFASYQESGATPGLGFDPIVDGAVVFANYTERAVAGQQANIPAIIGTNAQDGVPFVTYHPTGPSNQTLVLEALLSTFFCPATETIRLRQETGRLTYRYLYAGNFSNISPKPWMGAYHSSELPLLMGTHPDFRGPSTALEYATSAAFQDAYVAFASDPVNGLVAQDWTPYAQIGAGNVREFGAAGVAVRDTSIGPTEALCDGAAPAAPL